MSVSCQLGFSIRGGFLDDFSRIGRIKKLLIFIFSDAAMRAISDITRLMGQHAAAVAAKSALAQHSTGAPHES